MESEAQQRDRVSFRVVYVHGWPFALKAVALAYHQARIDKLGPLADAMGTEGDAPSGSAPAERFRVQAGGSRAADGKYHPPLSFAELDERLGKIDWRRYRKHWIALTGATTDKNGRKKVVELADGQKVVAALAPNVAAAIGTVANTIVSKRWTRLCSARGTKDSRGRT